MTAETKGRSAKSGAESITVNFVEDGFTALGKVWYRGEELTVQKGSEDWDKTLTGGRSWLEFTEAQQEAAYGRRMFREGRWSGKKYEITDDLSDEEKAALLKANAERFGDPLPGNVSTKPKRGRPPRRPTPDKE